jgi:hypothetical protein
MVLNLRGIDPNSAAKWRMASSNIACTDSHQRLLRKRQRGDGEVLLCAWRPTSELVNDLRASGSFWRRVSFSCSRWMI